MARVFQDRKSTTAFSLLGDYQSFGTQYRVLTMRGWVIVENWEDLQGELKEVESICQQGNAVGSES